MTQRRVLGCGKEMQKGTRARGDFVATGTNQDLLNFRESSESTMKLAAHLAENSESIDGNDKVWPQSLHNSTACVPHLEKVFSNLRQHFGRKQETKWKISM